MPFTEKDKRTLVQNIREASKIIKLNISPDRFEDVFELMNNIPVANGDLIVEALAEREINSNDDIDYLKWSIEYGVVKGVLLHNVTLSYIKKMLKDEELL